MLIFCHGDMFATPFEIRVNAVNCVGVMGRGLAAQFKARYPAMFIHYRRACLQGLVQPGRLHLWISDDGETVINFPTKRHWRDNSREEDIAAGLQVLRTFLATREAGVRVALPALGCGNGRLEWVPIRRLIETYLGDIDASITVFLPCR